MFCVSYVFILYSYNNVSQRKKCYFKLSQISKISSNIFIEKKLGINRPGQFKPMLFKDQLDMQCKETRKCNTYINQKTVYIQQSLFICGFDCHSFTYLRSAEIWKQMILFLTYLQVRRSVSKQPHAVSQCVHYSPHFISSCPHFIIT